MFGIVPANVILLLLKLIELIWLRLNPVFLTPKCIEVHELGLANAARETKLGVALGF